MTGKKPRGAHREILEMTNALYLEDSYCAENPAAVVGVCEGAVVLDRTCMYPGGGGQPCDIGLVRLASGARLDVAKVTKATEGTIIHHCSSFFQPPTTGERCNVCLDWQRRFALMRHHTALHVFNTVMLRRYGGWITGVSIGVDVSHIDFNVEHYDAGVRKGLEEDVNHVLLQQLPVSSYWISEAEFRNRSDLLRTLEVKPPLENGRLRVVELEGFEAQACGGTHVRNTREVGELRIDKVRSKGRQNRRFYVSLSEPA